MSGREGSNIGSESVKNPNLVTVMKGVPDLEVHISVVNATQFKSTLTALIILSRSLFICSAFTSLQLNSPVGNIHQVLK